MQLPLHSAKVIVVEDVERQPCCKLSHRQRGGGSGVVASGIEAGACLVAPGHKVMVGRLCIAFSKTSFWSGFSPMAAANSANSANPFKRAQASAP